MPRGLRIYAERIARLSGFNRGDHLAHGFGHPDLDGARDDRMPDRQLAERISPEERADVRHGEAVARVRREPGLVEPPRRPLDARQLAIDAVGAPRVRV